jgi:uncharacterized protein
MTATPSYPAGTPIWVDLSSPDPAASARFYGALFGWEGEDLGEQAGHYHMFRKDGKTAAGASQTQGGAPPAWSTYVATDDADGTAAKVSQAGGQVIVAPFDVMDQGRMAVFADPSGAFFSIWRSAAMNGAEHMNAPGGFCWNELSSRVSRQ